MPDNNLLDLGVVRRLEASLEHTEAVLGQAIERSQALEGRVNALTAELEQERAKTVAAEAAVAAAAKKPRSTPRKSTPAKRSRAK